MQKVRLALYCFLTIDLLQEELPTLPSGQLLLQSLCCQTQPCPGIFSIILTTQRTSSLRPPKQMIATLESFRLSALITF